MKDLLEFIVKQLVSDKDAVVIETVETESSITFKLSVAQDDMGRVIGREGRIAKSLRTIIKACGRNEQKAIFVDIV